MGVLFRGDEFSHDIDFIMGELVGLPLFTAAFGVLTKKKFREPVAVGAFGKSNEF